MIDSITGWIEIRTLPSARTDLVAHQVELAWLTHCPLPNKLKMDSGHESLANFRDMVRNDYSITVKPTTSWNPQVNSILEIVL